MLARVRFFCRIENTLCALGQRSIAYFRALNRTSYTVRVVPVAATDVGAPDSAWTEYAEALTVPVAAHFVNVVCGLHEDFPRLYTVGVPNIAVVGGPRLPSTDEVHALAQYDAVICEYEHWAEPLRMLGVQAMVMPPDAKQLERLLERFDRPDPC